MWRGRRFQVHGLFFQEGLNSFENAHIIGAAHKDSVKIFLTYFYDITMQPIKTPLPRTAEQPLIVVSTLFSSIPIQPQYNRGNTPMSLNTLNPEPLPRTAEGGTYPRPASMVAQRQCKSQRLQQCHQITIVLIVVIDMKVKQIMVIIIVIG